MKIPGRKKKQENQNRKPQKYKLVDFAPLKDFLSYGINKTTINLKLKRQSDIIARETLMKRGEQRDWGEMWKFAIYGVLIVVIAFVLLTQVMNYNDVQTSLTECYASKGVAETALLQCQQGLVSGIENIVG